MRNTRRISDCNCLAVHPKGISFRAPQIYISGLENYSILMFFMIYSLDMTGLMVDIN